MKSFVEKYKRKANATKTNMVDFKELKALREKHFYKFKDGKNQFIVLWPEGQEDAISTWGYYNNLLEQPYFSIPADNYNKGEDCPIHSVLEQLKENEDENRPVINPIDLKVDDYAVIVPIDEDGNYDENCYWRKIPYSIMKEFITHFENLEEDEDVFYDRENPAKVIVNYDSKAAPSAMYSVSFKPLKKNQLPTKEQYATWVASIITLDTFNPSRTFKQKEEIITNYISRTVEAISEDSEE